MSETEWPIDAVHDLDEPAQLADYYPEPHPLVIEKVRDHIDEKGQGMIAASPFLVLATQGAQGLDCSPKGDAPGFVVQKDERTLLLPDRPGNNRLDGLRNILTDPRVALIFLVPGQNETYRINGTARISVDSALRERFSQNGKPARAVLVIEVQEAFLHCGRALLKAGLWQERKGEVEAAAE